MKIGVFDSGVGGITVLAELKQRLSSVNYVYLGDTANLPYGSKSPAQIETLSIRCAQMLKQKEVDALIVACNTASSLALSAIQTVMAPIPVFGVVDPGVQAALGALNLISLQVDPVPILVLATRATIQSQAYGKSLRNTFENGNTFKNRNIEVFEQACPLLVPLIEEGWIQHPVLDQVIQEYVRPYLKEFKKGVALLGCTHYPWIHDSFQAALPGWQVVNSAWAVAQALERSEFFKTAQKPDEANVGRVEWMFTDPKALPEFAKKFIQNRNARDSILIQPVLNA
jgi:glutamate racemase